MEFPYTTSGVIWQWPQVPGEGRGSGEQWQYWPHKCTFQVERDSLKLESQRPVRVASLGPVRTDNGAGCLDTESGPWGGWCLFVLQKGLAWSLGVSTSPKLGNILVKTFSFPLNLCVMPVYGGRQTNPTLFNNYQTNYFLLWKTFSQLQELGSS